jgi:hypothetical protein
VTQIKVKRERRGLCDRRPKDLRPARCGSTVEPPRRVRSIVSKLMGRSMYLSVEPLPGPLRVRLYPHSPKLDIVFWVKRATA